MPRSIRESLESQPLSGLVLAPCNRARQSTSGPQVYARPRAPVRRQSGRTTQPVYRYADKHTQRANGRLEDMFAVGLVFAILVNNTNPHETGISGAVCNVCIFQGSLSSKISSSPPLPTLFTLLLSLTLSHSL